jgi:FixJ family two-component response regulator
MQQPTVYVVDDDRIARESLAWLIESARLPVKMFARGLDFLDALEPGQTGCVVLDVRMPDINGMELFARLKDRRSTLPVIIVTGHGDVPMAVRAMKAGAYDFVEKPYNNALMLERIQSAIAFDLDNRKEQERLRDVQERIASLTPREREVLELVLRSHANKTIADKLGISIKTVELHRANLMAKMQAGSSTELVRLALIAGLE